MATRTEKKDSIGLDLNIKGKEQSRRIQGAEPANESQGKELDKRLRVRAERFRVLFKERRIRDRKPSRSVRHRRSRVIRLQVMGR
jgi:hypothetical protein